MVENSDRAARRELGTSTGERLITVELTGGLANQLFQWAGGFLAAEQSGARLVLDARLVERPDGRGVQVENIVPPLDILYPTVRERRFWVFLHRWFPRRFVGMAKRLRRRTFEIGAGAIVSTMRQSQEALASSQCVRHRGLFQDVNSLLEKRSLLREAVLPRLMEFSGPIHDYAAMHVRRGDYVSVGKYTKRFGVCSIEYFVEAARRLDPDLPLIVVTDDREWVTATLAKSLSGKVVSVSSAESHFQDLAILAGASQLVLSNSTFSWWGAFLGTASLVTYPSPWFSDAADEQDLPLSTWISLPRNP